MSEPSDQEPVRPTVLASGERSVSVGGDARNIYTGDIHTTRVVTWPIRVGVAPPLADQYVERATLLAGVCIEHLQRVMVDRSIGNGDMIIVCTDCDVLPIQLGIGARQNRYDVATRPRAINESHVRRH